MDLITPTRAEGGLVFFSLLRPFLIEGVLGSKNLAKVDGNTLRTPGVDTFPDPVGQFGAP